MSKTYHNYMKPETKVVITELHSLLATLSQERRETPASVSGSDDNLEYSNSLSRHSSVWDE